MIIFLHYTCMPNDLKVSIDYILLRIPAWTKVLVTYSKMKSVICESKIHETFFFKIKCVENQLNNTLDLFHYNLGDLLWTYLSIGLNDLNHILGLDRNYLSLHFFSVSILTGQKFREFFVVPSCKFKKWKQHSKILQNTNNKNFMTFFWKKTTHFL